MIPPPNDWTELKTAFTELVDLAPDERAVRLAAITASDSALGTRLAVLLDADTAADRQLARFELLSAGVADTQHGPREEASADPLGLCGRTVAHFRIHDVLGSGGMGVAYRAEDQRLGRSVALKFLLPQLTADADATRDFLHEARTASALDHPNICTLLEVGESPHGLFLAMPAYAGETLQQRLARDGRIPVAEAVGIARQVLQGLAAAHAAGVTHRDLKPGNLMLTPDGTVKILDFGLARSADLEISASGARAGTIAYMSPEQVRGEAVDRRGDLWAVGVVLYQMLTGERPFGSGRDLSTLYAILHDDPPPLSARAPDVPPQLDAVVARLLRRDADERYADAAEAIAALDETTAGTPGGRVSTSRRRRRFVLAAVILMAAAAAVVPFVRRAGTTGPEVVVEQASVAVLPFTDTSPQRDQQHLGEGVAEEILNALVAVPGLRVPARGSSFRFSSDDDVPMGELARRLGVGALLEGTVHRDGDRIRISARLLDARTGRYLWSQTFDRRFRDIFAVQADIARTVAEALEVHLTADAQRAQPTQNIVAYELYLRGLFHWNRRTPHDLRQAIDFFTQATRHDTTYAQPYAGLALSHAVLAVLQPAASDLPGRTHEPAARALRLDSTLAEAHAARGYAYHWQWRWREAERELERAISLNPAYATAHQWYGEHLTKMGRVREGVAHVQRAIELDPLSLVAQSDLGLVLMLSGRLAESIAQFEHVRRLDPAFPLPLLLLHRVHMFAGDTAAAAEAGRRWAEITGAADAAELMLLARATRDTTLRSEARTVLVRWQREPAPRWPDIAMYFMLLGDHDDALRALELALQARAPMLASMKVAPWMDPVREDPRFLAVLRQLDFP